LKIVIATDAWHPQVNGVVRSLAATVQHLLERGQEVMVIEPGLFRTIPCPTYPEIRLALRCSSGVRRMIENFQPDAVHVATEGPIGWAARKACLRARRSFTTAFHTRFPDYVSIRTGIPAKWIWKVMRRFHGAAEGTFTATAALADELRANGIGRTHNWPRGVDLDEFNPSVPPHPEIDSLPRPVILNVGRVAVEKNIGAFLDCPVPGTKVVVGDGPALKMFRERYPNVVFMGARHGAELASCYAAADVFVFPSRTDTFGLVNIEALACGVPVAAFPVAGPADIIGERERGMHGGSRPIGALDADLAAAIRRALDADRQAAAMEASYYSWARCTELFLKGLSVSRSEEPACAIHELPPRDREPRRAEARRLRG
jgi:glycosyltransferase involved in cell wall biosynthesis